MQRKLTVRKIIAIRPSTVGPPLDEVAYTAQLATLYLAAEKPQLVVQLERLCVLVDGGGERQAWVVTRI